MKLELYVTLPDGYQYRAGISLTTGLAQFAVSASQVWVALMQRKRTERP